MCSFPYTVPQRYTNPDLKICQYLRLNMKIICRRFHIKTAFTFEVCAREICEKFVYIRLEAIEQDKNQPTFYEIYKLHG